MNAPLAIDLALRLTLLDLLLRPVGDWTIRPLVLGFAAILLLRAPWLRHPLPWAALAALTGARALLDWPLADNHAYLLAYWCLAAALALGTHQPDRVLAFNGRLLIGLVFLFASLWKLAGAHAYLDGTFFQVTFLTDPRFEGFARIAGGLDQETFERLRAVVEQHRDTAAPHPESPIDVPPRFESLAQAAALWNLCINAALASVFLWPGCRGSLDQIRHALLLLYCVVTYAIATVDGFGWLLLAMGSARCAPEQRRTRLAYVVVFVLIILYREIPWAQEVLLPLLGPSAASV